MAENIRMDTHKLMLHPDRVATWLMGSGTVYPLEIEIGLSGACNHRCIFCAVDYMEYKPCLLTRKVMEPNLKIMGQKGVKSIIYAGEGEPLVNPETPDIINLTKECGMDAAMSTNGVLFTKEKAASCLKSLSWVRFSIAGASDATYEKIHQCHKGDLQKALQNMTDAANIKRKQALNTTLGAQLLLLPENKKEVVSLAKIIRSIGFDYFTVKPFSQHPSSKIKREVDYSETEEIENQVKELATDSFSVYFRRQSIINIEHEKNYDKCHALPFMTHISATGDIFPCVAFVGKKEFNFGNINKDKFSDIWERQQTQEIMHKFSGDFLKTQCRKACRLDEMNKYLHALKHPTPEMSFL